MNSWDLSAYSFGSLLSVAIWIQEMGISCCTQEEEAAGRWCSTRWCEGRSSVHRPEGEVPAWASLQPGVVGSGLMQFLLLQCGYLPLLHCLSRSYFRERKIISKPRGPHYFYPLTSDSYWTSDESLLSPHQCYDSNYTIELFYALPNSVTT